MALRQRCARGADRHRKSQPHLQNWWGRYDRDSEALWMLYKKNHVLFYIPKFIE